MLRVGFKALTSMAALSAVLVVGSMRALHSDSTDLQNIVTKTTADSGSPWLSFAPDCALLSLLLFTRPRDFVCGCIRRKAVRLQAHFEEFAQHIRPPPQIT